MREDLEAKVKDMVKKYVGSNIDISQIKNTDSLNEDLKIDSLSFVKLVINIEEEFNIEFEEEYIEIRKFSTVNSLIDFIAQKTAEA